MKTSIQKVERISRLAPLKALIIGVLSVFILIPGSMIQNFIREKQMRNSDTVRNSNAQLHNSQAMADANFFYQKTENRGEYPSYK